MNSIYNYSRKSLEEIFIQNNFEKFRATQCFEWLYKKQITDFKQLTNMKKDAIAFIEEHFALDSLEIVTVQTSNDGTKKYLFRLKDGNLLETVLMPQLYGYSVCVSSQVGCNMGCAFCASGKTKKVRDLETSEMLLQVLTIDRFLREEGKKVSHVVVMGIGEPFDNYDNLLEFISIINDPKGLEIGARHITVSTCGLVNKIREFAEVPLQINLAISLHFANDELRSKYMAINRRYPIREIIDALKYYYQRTNRRITFEYILLKDINDSLSDAQQLASLLKGMNAYVNLIPYNDTSEFKRSDKQTILAFYDVLKKNHINVTLRKELGTEISAACGQLRVNKMGDK